MTALRSLWLAAVVAMACLVAGCSGPGGEEPAAPKTPAADKPAAEKPAEAPKTDSLAWAVQQAPADACVVVAVSGIADLEKNLKALVGPDADEMKLVEDTEKKLPAGTVDAAGPMVAVVLTSADKLGMVFLFRVQDESKIQGEAAGAGIVKMKMPTPPALESTDGPVPEAAVYVLKMAPWAAVSDDVASLKTLMRAEKRLVLTDAQCAAVAARTLWANLNLPALANLAGTVLDKQMKMQAEQGGPATPPATMKMVHWILALADQVEAMDVAADIRPEGIKADVTAAMVDGSPLLQIMGAARPVGSAAMGLPASDRLVLAGWGGADWGKAMPPVKALAKGLFDIFAEGEDEATRKSMDDLWNTYEKWGGILGDQFALAMMAADPGKGMYQLVETFQVKDPEAYRKLIKEYMTTSLDATKTMMSKFMVMPGAPGMQGVKADGDFKEAAETIEGVPVDIMTFKFSMELPPDAPPQAKAQIDQMMAAMYGPDGMVMRMAVVDKTGVVAVGDAALMAQAIKTIRGQGADLAADARVAAALKRAGQGGSGIGLVSLGNYMYMAMGMADRMMSANLPKEILDGAEADGIKPLAPPPAGDLVTLTSRLDGRAVRVAIDVPKSEIDAAVETGKQFGQRMQYFMKKQMDMQQNASDTKAAPAP
ncbi:MAG: hypothetical protein IMZ55_08730, partial [Acidobacteria bacterium]|nr:hypothetical protein [Acidobacteriota bacterium]